MSANVTNRPYKWGSNDRREFIVQDSEVALRCENNSSGSPIYVGRAKVGVLDAETKWQICFIEAVATCERRLNSSRNSASKPTASGAWAANRSKVTRWS